ncbi:MAG: hypothetical protein KDB80_18430, partial [Planctomycetes bacterium]|nr:hypothetical protein [Planctomycetota bacterium]
HTDHSADLAALLFALRNPNFDGRKPLALRGAFGLRKLLDDIETAWPWCRRGDYELDVAEVEPGAFRLGSLSIETARIEHTDASLGYRITGSNGATAAFSGDATFCDGVVSIARDVDLFVCDSAFPTDELNVGHMTPTEAGRAASIAGAKTLCLTHFYPECEGFDLTALARTEYDGEIVEACDLLRFHLG